MLLIILTVLSRVKAFMSRGKDKNNLFTPSILNSLIKLHKGSMGSLSRKISIDRALLTRIMDGTTPDPRLSSLVRIAQYFGVTVSQLIGEEKIDFKEVENWLKRRLKTDKSKQQTALSRKDIVFSVTPFKKLMELTNNNPYHLSTQIKTAHSSLFDILLGKRTDPRINTLLKISSHFKITVSQLIGEEKIDFKKLEKPIKKPLKSKPKKAER